jgi:hypothetical protein
MLDGPGHRKNRRQTEKTRESHGQQLYQCTLRLDSQFVRLPRMLPRAISTQNANCPSLKTQVQFALIG